MGLAIANLRQRKSLTQKQLGELIGVTEDQIANWESGRQGQEIESAIKLCLELECSPSSLNGETIKQARQKRSLTQSALASRLACDIRTVQRWESGDTIGGLNWLIQLCNILECSAKNLLT